MRTNSVSSPRTASRRRSALLAASSASLVAIRRGAGRAHVSGCRGRAGDPAPGCRFRRSLAGSHACGYPSWRVCAGSRLGGGPVRPAVVGARKPRTRPRRALVWRQARRGRMRPAIAVPESVHNHEGSRPPAARSRSSSSGGSDRQPAALPPQGSDLHPALRLQGARRPLGGRCLIEHLVDRLRSTGVFDPIWVAGPAERLPAPRALDRRDRHRPRLRRQHPGRRSKP